MLKTALLKSESDHLADFVDIDIIKQRAYFVEGIMENLMYTDFMNKNRFYRDDFSNIELYLIFTT